MLTRINVKNFKSIRDLTVEISDNIFVLAGQNESGKSSVLEAIYYFQQRESNIDTINFEEQSADNLKQEISMTFDFDKFVNREVLVDEMVSEFSAIFDIPNLIINENIINIISKIKTTEITWINDFGSNVRTDYFNVDKDTKAMLHYIWNSILNVNPEAKDRKLIFETKVSRLVEVLWNNTPYFVFFNEVEDLLPDSINLNLYLEDKVELKGRSAVNNFETIIGVKFSDINSKTFNQKKTKIDFYNNKISVDFRNDWNQKLGDTSKVTVSFEITNDDTGQPNVYFLIDTKDGVPLPLRQRSKGLIWFFSLWLELKANEDKPMIWLFDEPGAYLHINAHKDMLNVFKRLKKKGHQIIYSTHTPSLIDTDNLANIGLVYNSLEIGSKIEGITSSKFDSQNKRDALQPVASAMGFSPTADFSVLAKKNVILEGLSDFYYFTAMAKILEIECDYKFVPALGIKMTKVTPLISFCVGYGLEWLLIMDNGNNPKVTKEELSSILFESNMGLADRYIYITEEKEIEDLFDIEDFKNLKSAIINNSAKLPSATIGDKNKVIISKLFHSKVMNGTIDSNNISEKAKKRFTDVFNFINTALKSK